MNFPTEVYIRQLGQKTQDNLAIFPRHAYPLDLNYSSFFIRSADQSSSIEIMAMPCSPIVLP